MGELSRLPNVGRVLEKNLNEIGVFTAEQLREMGSREAFIRIRMIDPGACLHMLYGIQGAIEGIRDNLLPESTKRDLREFYKQLCG
ncbi:MAG TPA: TfoX/Sxy family protein [Thermoclostridium sp.]|nr:TfoX/Sxy family protein [Clostridiaceae bacterium]HOQ76466.1 TfoX/Sxy family protein [Thermoclostridium sp.]